MKSWDAQKIALQKYPGEQMLSAAPTRLVRRHLPRRCFLVSDVHAWRWARRGSAARRQPVSFNTKRLRTKHTKLYTPKANSRTLKSENTRGSAALNRYARSINLIDLRTLQYGRFLQVGWPSPSAQTQRLQVVSRARNLIAYVASIRFLAYNRALIFNRVWQHRNPNASFYTPPLGMASSSPSSLSRSLQNAVDTSMPTTAGMPKGRSVGSGLPQRLRIAAWAANAARGSAVPSRRTWTNPRMRAATFQMAMPSITRRAAHTTW